MSTENQEPTQQTTPAQAQGATPVEDKLYPPATPAKVEPAAPVADAKPVDPVAPVETKEPVIEGDKKPDEKAAEPVPEKYELKLPEGSKLSQEHLATVEAYAKEHKLSQVEAQSLVERDNEFVSNIETQQRQFLETQWDKWKNETLADKELGGEKLKETMHFCDLALKEFASDGLKAELNKTGFGNNPEVVRAFARIGRAMSNDNFVRSGSLPVAKKSLEETLYGPSTEQ